MNFKNKFVENFLSLTVLRGLTLIVPLITYPYLIRVLGSEVYGLVMWAWSIVNFFILFINFGFNLSVTKYVAIHKEDKKKLSEIVSTTIATKFFLFVVAFLAFLILLYTVPKMTQNKELFFWTFALTLGETMMPIWYFQGIEKMKYTAVITSFVKIGFAILVFLIIQKQDDYLKVPILYALASMVSALFAYYLIFIRDKNSLILPKITNVLFYIKDSAALFVSSSIYLLRESLIIVFIENYLGLSAVALFDIAQKFTNILLTPFHILSSVLFPHMSHAKNFSLLKKIMLYSSLFASFLFTLVYLFSSQIAILMYGGDGIVAQYTLIILASSVVFKNLTALLATDVIVVGGKQHKLFISSLVDISMFFVILYFLFYLNYLSLIAVAWAVVMMSAINVMVLLYFSKDILSMNLTKKTTKEKK